MGCGEQARGSRWPRAGHRAPLLHFSWGGRTISWEARRILGEESFLSFSGLVSQDTKAELGLHSTRGSLSIAWQSP